MRVAAILSTLLALSLTAAAAAVGPSLPDVSGAVTANEVSYAVAPHGETTTLTKRLRGRTVLHASIPGRWGIPLVTLSYATHGGLSPDGHTLVLGDNVTPGGLLRGRSAFAVIDTRSLTLSRIVELRGDYSFDALSRGGHWLYLIHHVRVSDNRYAVQAYDLKAGRLLPGVIADKSQEDWVMAGLPVSRTTSPGGTWVYTLYQRPGAYPFIHALDTASRTAVCISLPSEWEDPGAANAIGTARLKLSGTQLKVTSAAGRGLFALDTSTFKVTTLG